jgi:hypothetical protein
MRSNKFKVVEPLVATVGPLRSLVRWLDSTDIRAEEYREQSRDLYRHRLGIE